MKWYHLSDIIKNENLGGGHSDREYTSSHSEQRSEDCLRRWYYILCGRVGSRQVIDTLRIKIQT